MQHRDSNVTQIHCTAVHCTSGGSVWEREGDTRALPDDWNDDKYFFQLFFLSCFLAFVGVHNASRYCLWQCRHSSGNLLFPGLRKCWFPRSVCLLVWPNIPGRSADSWFTPVPQECDPMALPKTVLLCCFQEWEWQGNMTRHWLRPLVTLCTFVFFWIELFRRPIARVGGRWWGSSPPRFVSLGWIALTVWSILLMHSTHQESSNWCCGYTISTCYIAMARLSHNKPSWASCIPAGDIIWLIDWLLYEHYCIYMLCVNNVSFMHFMAF